MTDTEAPVERRALEYVALDALQPAERNAKLHDQESMQRSVRRFGFIEPIIVDDRTGKLIAGHGRVDQLRQAKRRNDAVPTGVIADADQWYVPVVRGWASADDGEAEAAALALNHIGELGGWDDNILADMLIGVSETDFGLEGTGFTHGTIDKLLSRNADEATDGSAKLGMMHYRIVIECDDEAHQITLLERMIAEGLDARAVLS